MEEQQQHQVQVLDKQIHKTKVHRAKEIRVQMVVGMIQIGITQEECLHTWEISQMIHYKLETILFNAWIYAGSLVIVVCCLGMIWVICGNIINYININLGEINQIRDKVKVKDKIKDQEQHQDKAKVQDQLVIQQLLVKEMAKVL